jgi:hypothetical protein
MAERVIVLLYCIAVFTHHGILYSVTIEKQGLEKIDEDEIGDEDVDGDYHPHDEEVIGDEDDDSNQSGVMGWFS